jgi:RHS repeat-associated protein
LQYASLISILFCARSAGVSPYDGSGNRATETVTQSGQSTVTTYQYNEQSRLTATQTEQPDGIARLVDFYYDNNGNMVGRTSATLTPDNTSAAILSLAETEDEAALYDYDVWNNMISSTVDGETTTHTYNGDGLRVSKTASGLTTRYAYEYNEVVLELDGNGNQKALNVRGHKLLARVTSAGSSWFMYNGHGDVTTLTNGTNTVQATYYYDAFGVHREQTSTADNPYRYSGYTFDEESGLYYLNARFYDPELARFMQEDTYRGDPGDPLSLNLYTYVCNNPLVYWDPTGHATATLTNGQTVNCTIKNGITYMPDGSRPAVGTVVHADNGKDYQMTESGGKEVPKGSTGVAVSTPSGTQAGLLNNGSTTMTVSGTKPTNGSVVHTPQGGDYRVENGVGVKVNPVVVTDTNNNTSVGYTSNGHTLMLDGNTVRQKDRQYRLNKVGHIKLLTGPV